MVQTEESQANDRHWHGELHLHYQRRGERTVLAGRRHCGPLAVQKPFYPESEAVCHGIVLHPPGGIVGGDELTIDAQIEARAGVLLTTPGAARWYRSAGPHAQQALRVRIGAGASLEWLPQPSIVFDGARGRASTEVRLDADGCYIGWEIVCLGRTAAGERYRQGDMQMQTRLVREDAVSWTERARIEGGSRLLVSPLGLDGEPVSGTLIAAFGTERLTRALGDRLLQGCRALAPSSGRGGITRLPGVFVARYLGSRSDAAHDYFVRLWQLLRPTLLGRAALSPRIWKT